LPVVQCPKCRHLNRLDENTYFYYSGIYRCMDCGTRIEVYLSAGRLMKTPKVLDLTSVEGAPLEVNEDFVEAQKCYDAEAYKATIVICRRALETMSDLQQAKGKNLFDKIEDLYSRELISKGTSEIATQVRQFGNYGAHPKDDLLGGITERDAGVILEITQHLLKDVYEIPRKVEKLKKRLQKK